MSAACLAPKKGKPCSCTWWPQCIYILGTVLSNVHWKAPFEWEFAAAAMIDVTLVSQPIRARPAWVCPVGSIIRIWFWNMMVTHDARVLLSMVKQAHKIQWKSYESWDMAGIDDVIDSWLTTDSKFAFSSFAFTEVADAHARMENHASRGGIPIFF